MSVIFLVRLYAASIFVVVVIGFHFLCHCFGVGKEVRGDVRSTGFACALHIKEAPSAPSRFHCLLFQGPNISSKWVFTLVTAENSSIAVSQTM